jgi:hypothetical protein
MPSAPVLVETEAVVDVGVEVELDDEVVALLARLPEVRAMSTRPLTRLYGPIEGGEGGPANWSVSEAPCLSGILKPK